MTDLKTFCAEVDALVARLGWPDDVAMIALTNPPHGCRVISVTVTLGEIAGNGAYRGTAGTLTNALELAKLEQSKVVEPLRFTPVVVGGAS